MTNNAALGKADDAAQSAAVDIQAVDAAKYAPVSTTVDAAQNAALGIADDIAKCTAVGKAVDAANNAALGIAVDAAKFVAVRATDGKADHAGS
jgi:hypothetical protein